MMEGIPSRLADALEAASKLELYFKQITSDFAVINDLLPKITTTFPTIPARRTSVRPSKRRNSKFG